MTLTSALLTVIKRAAAPLIYRNPPFGLQPQRLAVYLHGLLERTSIPGDVAEVGCAAGGTAAIASRMLSNVGWTGTYICYDTFSGFVPEQFDADAKLGTTGRGKFSANSPKLVRAVLNQYGAAGVKLVEGDITTLPEEQLSPLYSVVLLDIDLSEPTHKALHRFWPRLAPGGIIYVDDCPEETNWKARIGYAKFCREAGLPEQYEYGFGVVQRPKEGPGAEAGRDDGVTEPRQDR